MTLYTQKCCPQCQIVHMLLDKKGIKYDECQDLELMKAAGVNHTPTIENDGKLYVGPDALKFVKGLN